MHNPEAISRINAHPEVFELIVRPFSHDIALLRIGEGFAINLEYGRRTIEREFSVVRKYFLPPEFMLTNEQLAYLSREKYDGVFIKPDRFADEIAKRIPRTPYNARGLFGAELYCIPFADKLTDAYLRALHLFDAREWSSAVESFPSDLALVWRDGESSFLFPHGLEREGFWLAGERASICRRGLTDIHLPVSSNAKGVDEPVSYYPVHSFAAWMREFRMLGFLSRIKRVEAGLRSLPLEMIYRWLQVINSDILSAVEKSSPVVQIRQETPTGPMIEFEIRRSERGLEGEEYLALLEEPERSQTIQTSTAPHIVKWRSRIEYLRRLDAAGDSRH